MRGALADDPDLAVQKVRGEALQVQDVRGVINSESQGESADPQGGRPPGAVLPRLTEASRVELRLRSEGVRLWPRPEAVRRLLAPGICASSSFCGDTEKSNVVSPVLAAAAMAAGS